MKSNKRVKILLFAFIFLVSVTGGIIMSVNEKTFREFSVEKHPLGAPVSSVEDVEEITQDEKGRININTDNVSELVSLDGIGYAMAERIINYRKQYGDFEVIEDLMRVNGIGKKKFDTIKERLYIE